MNSFSHLDKKRHRWFWGLSHKSSGIDTLFIDVQWKLGLHSWWIKFDWGHEEAQIGFSISLFGVCLGVRINHLFPESWTGIKKESNYRPGTFYYSPVSRSIGFSYFHGSEKWATVHTAAPMLSLFFWRTEEQWEDNLKTWFDKTFWPFDWLFGESQHRRAVVREGPKTLVISDSETYDVDVRVELFIYKRNRWPGRQFVYHFDINCEGGIPTGEVRMGEFDSCYSLSAPLSAAEALSQETLDIVVARFRKDILKTRQKTRYNPANYFRSA